MFKNKLFKYFSLELLKSFSVILVTLSFIIWFNQAARYLDLVTENGNPINVYLIFVFFQFPKIFSQLFLFSLLVSLFYTISKLENENESGKDSSQSQKVVITKFENTFLAKEFLLKNSRISGVGVQAKLL